MTAVDEPLPLDRGCDAPAAASIQVSPLVRRLVAPNPGPMTFTGTCTYIVGAGPSVAVIDPGPDLPEHRAAILAAIGDARATHILVTHTHRDHSPGAAPLALATGAQVVGCAPYAPAREPRQAERAAVAASNDLDFAPDRVLADGEALRGDGFTLVAVATPGHTMNHLAFALPEEKALFSGDHVMAWSTTVIAPPTGSMRAFMASLERLRGRDDLVYWPGHGGPVTHPPRFLRALLHHRRQREQALRTRLAAGDSTVPELVACTYETLPDALRRAAGITVLAHLEDLCERGLVRADGEGLEARYRPAPP